MAFFVSLYVLSLEHFRLIGMKRFFLLVFCLMSFGVVAQDGWVAPLESKDIINPYEGNQIAVQKGGVLFQKLCWTCHGKAGLGDGPAGKNLNPRPKNFKLESVQNQADGELFWKISNGRIFSHLQCNFMKSENYPTISSGLKK